jgi:hypothetical protein
MKVARILSLAAAFVLLLLIAPSVFAQTTGRIEGTVLDQNGAPLPGVTVEASSPNMQGTRTAVTGNDGHYRLPSLPPGVYKVTATLTSLGTVEKTANVLLDQTATLNLQLSLAAKETVVVTGEAPMVDTTSTTGGTNYSSKVIDKLPTGRNYAEIIRLNPGVNQDQGDTQGRAVSLTVYGATSVENQFIIDGVNTHGERHLPGDARQRVQPDGFRRRPRRPVRQGQALVLFRLRPRRQADGHLAVQRQLR